MNVNKSQLISVFSFICMAALLCGAGYYFGYKTKMTQLEADYTKNLLAKEEELKNRKEEKIVVKEVTGVQWIKPNQQPSCDKDHDIKGKFSGPSGQYYTKTYKTYGKIIPEICFATEEFARDTAGFIKKF